MTEEESKALPIGSLVNRVGRKSTYIKTGHGNSKGCCAFRRIGKYGDPVGQYFWLYGSEIVLKEATLVGGKTDGQA